MKTNLFIFLRLILFLFHFCMQNREEEIDPSSEPEPVPCIPSQRNIHVRTGWPKKEKEGPERQREAHPSGLGRSKQASKSIFYNTKLLFATKHTRLCMPPPLFLPPTQQQSPVLSSSSSSCFLLFCAGQFVNCNHPPGSFSFWVFHL